jgi:hypothetical protein
MKKKILIALLVIIVLIQLIRPEKNLSNKNENDVAKKYPLSQPVSVVLQKACNDCHSNKTEYPWYTEIQPIGLWMNNHIKDGKRHLNFSDFTSAPIAVQHHNFEEIIETVEEGEMPLSSYTVFGAHADANLTEEEKNAIIAWARSQMDVIKANYPPDSLKRKPRQHH